MRCDYVCSDARDCIYSSVDLVRCDRVSADADVGVSVVAGADACVLQLC